MYRKDFNIHIKHFYFLILLLVVLESLHAWIFWQLSSIRFLMPLIFAILSFLVVFINPTMFSFKRKTAYILIILFLLARFGAVRGNINAYLGAAIESLNVILFVLLTRRYQLEAIEFLSKALGVIIGISLLAWIVFLLGVPLPYFTDNYGFSKLRNEAQYFFNNHYFFLVNKGTTWSNLMDLLLPRFSSIILEPGYLGLLMVVLLYINGFNFKVKTNIVFLVALIFTFSLAGWLLGAFSYVIFAIKNNKNKLKVITTIAVSVLLFNWFFSTYKNGANPVNEFILERLKYDDSKGTISGYNRTGEKFDLWFKNNIIDTSHLLMGNDDYDKYYKNSINVGWKPFVAQFGLIGLSLYLFFLFYSYYQNKNFETIGLFILYIAIFSRGHHEIFWSVFPILYIGGCTILNTKHFQSKSISIILK